VIKTLIEGPSYDLEIKKSNKQFKMTEAVPGPSGGHIIKQESESFGFFDSLDILATIATQELKSKNEEKEQTPDSVDTEYEDDSDGRSGGRGSVQPKKLAEMDVVNLEQIRSMSANTLLRIFTETDFDEMKRMYCYTCILMPGECEEKFQSFGNGSKAKKEVRQHLEEHVMALVAQGRDDFMAEPGLARKRRLKDVLGFVVKPQLPVVKRKIKPEPHNETEINIEKENAELTSIKKRKEEMVPLLSEISNDQESKRYRIKKELSEREEVDVKQEQYELRAPSKSVRIAIDEDHCYAFKPGRVKAEYWPEYDNNAATAFTSIQENDETYDHIKETSDLASAEAIQSCPVVLEEDYNSQGALYQQTFVVQTDLEATATVTEEISLEQGREGGELTTILYQEQLDQAQDPFYTETIMADCGMPGQAGLEEIKQPPVRIKNKRTVAAVSSEDKRLALNAMEELRSRGATTDDLICRLCSPARPFTAYSTLLTHYRSHAGLRPFECSLCGATFTRQHSLNYHLMTHANQTRFTCPHCNRKFRHPTHFKEHVKKHGEVVQFLCQFCSASLSTQSQYRKHLKMRHNKTIDIMGNVIDSPPDYKEREKVKRKRRIAKEEPDLSPEHTTYTKKRRRRKLKSEAPEISQYEEIVQSTSNNETGTVLYEETISLSESAQMYQNSEFYEAQDGYEIIETSTQNGSVLAVIQPNQHQTGASNVVKNESVVIKAAQVQGEVKTTSPKFTTQFVSTGAVPVSQGYIAISQPQVVSSQAPQSPVIFVVPNSGQKKCSEKELQAARKPLIVTADQKKPIVVSKFQSNAKQGVIAQINGQKVLLVPKKAENVKTPTLQKLQPMAVKVASTSSAGAASAVTAVKPAEGGQTDDKVVQIVQEALPPENQENDLENNKMSNILEQAMHEVFPTSLEEEKIETEVVEVETHKDNGAAAGDLYNPMRSPLKNRNKILCEVLGIGDS